jgi:hypothetical protein
MKNYTPLLLFISGLVISGLSFAWNYFKFPCEINPFTKNEQRVYYTLEVEKEKGIELYEHNLSNKNTTLIQGHE